MAERSTPFELVFGKLRDRFEAIQRGLEAAGADPGDRDRFLLQREVAELLRELRPESGLGAEVKMLGALVHHAYRFWRDGERVRVVTSGELAGVLEGGQAFRRSDVQSNRLPDESEQVLNARPPDRLNASYVQLPMLAVWAYLESGPPEPLDGWFAVRVSPSELEVLAILGVHPGRPGFTAVEVRGPRPDQSGHSERPPLFAPIASETGAAAGLAAVRDAGELLELAWRADDLP